MAQSKKPWIRKKKEEEQSTNSEPATRRVTFEERSLSDAESRKNENPKQQDIGCCEVM